MKADYTVLIDHITDKMKDQGEPLNSNQKMILAGSLTGLQQLIEIFGLQEAIKRLKK